MRRWTACICQNTYCFVTEKSPKNKLPRVSSRYKIKKNSSKFLQLACVVQFLQNDIRLISFLQKKSHYIYIFRSLYKCYSQKLKNLKASVYIKILKTLQSKFVFACVGGITPILEQGGGLSFFCLELKWAIGGKDIVKGLGLHTHMHTTRAHTCTHTCTQIHAHAHAHAHAPFAIRHEH